jgi:pilus assembly protein CpaF
MAVTATNPARGEEKSRSQRADELKADLHEQLIAGLDFAVMRSVRPEVLREELRRGAEKLCQSRAGLLSQNERQRLIDELVDETLGLGPLEPLMHDPTVSDILINGPGCVFVERRGRLEQTPIKFRDLDHLLGIVQRLASNVGRRIDESSPMVDARLLEAVD